MNILFIGVQGSGKGTQATRVAQKLGLCHISTGDLLRNATGALKKEIDATISKGHLVDDALMLRILKKRMKKPDCKQGIILDGFPRTLAQARLLDKAISIDRVFEIAISRKEATHRLSGRVHCQKCGHNYNLFAAPKPKRKGICDFDGSPLVRRADDTPRSIAKRIKTYYEKTEPILVEHYKDKVVSIDGERTIARITHDLMKHLS